MGQSESTIGTARGSSTASAEPLRRFGVDREYFSRLIQGMRCGILAVDRSGRVMMLNDHARLILEHGSPRAAGLAVEEALVDHPQLAQILRESFGMSSLPNRAEIDLKTRSEGGKTIGLTLSLVPGKDGVPAGAAMRPK